MPVLSEILCFVFVENDSRVFFMKGITVGERSHAKNDLCMASRMPAC